MIPHRAPNEPFEAHQNAMAAWMGADSVAVMNALHDPLHAALCGWLGVPSHALAEAAGEPHDQHLASLEEEAVLHVQRFMTHAGVALP